MARLSIFLIGVAFIAGTLGCDPGLDYLRIWNWHDLYAIRDNLSGHYVLMNDLDSASPGYTELASPTANQGRGWQPTGTSDDRFIGSFDGQGYEIRDLFINRPDESMVGLFGAVDEGGVIQNVGVVTTTVTGEWAVGGLLGGNWGAVSNSYSTGSVSGDDCVGGLVGGDAGGVSNSYSTASVTGLWDVGGLVGC
ncbi:MAG: GLUG motif-containing protein, partial [Desulfatiglandales bacterium]